MTKDFRYELEKRIKDISRSYFENDKWIYVKLQSLIEYAFNFYDNDSFQFKGRVSSKKYKLITKRIRTNYRRLEYFIPSYTRINNYANKIKHYNMNADFKNDFFEYMDECITVANKFLNDIFPFEKFRINTSQLKKTEINLELAEILSDKNIYVASFGNESGNGLIIKNIPSFNSLLPIERSIYATVYGFVTRTRISYKSLFVKKYEIEVGVLFNPTKLLNYEVIILLLIKNGYFSSNNSINIDYEDEQLFDVAFNDIKNYVELLSQLIKKEVNSLSYSFGDRGLDLTDGAKKYLTPSNYRIMESQGFSWIEPKLKYKIEDGDKDLNIIHYFLEDFFGYNEFNLGQQHSIKKILNSSSNTLTLMPTGTGKSLIFYYVSLLYSGPTLVITPTDLLMEDQIRNLEEEFNITNVYGFTFEQDLLSSIGNIKFLYCSTSHFLFQVTYVAIMKSHEKNPFSQIIIDEIHTISSWSHDFRAESLMLSEYVKSNFPLSLIHTFTATATFRVIKDITVQFNIANESVISTKTKINENFIFEYKHQEDESYHQLADMLQKLLANREREEDKIVVFTSNIRESKSVINYLENHINENTAFLDVKGTISYSEFVDGEVPILIAASDLGIGINLKEIKYSIHFELSKSMSEYIQEIGRASRDDRKCYSYIFLKHRSKLYGFERKLLDYSTDHEDIVNILRENKSIDSVIKGYFSNVLDNGYSFEGSIKYTVAISHHAGKTVNIGRQANLMYLYVLYIIGVISDWHYLGKDEYNVMRVVTTTGRQSTVNYYRKCLLGYFKRIGEDKRYYPKIMKANDLEELITIFYTWWYNEYLYFIKESLREMFDFILSGIGRDNKLIVEELNSYLSITSMEISEIEKLTTDLSYKDLDKYDLPRILEMRNSAYQALLVRYNPVLDLILFISDTINRGEPNEDRLGRIINKTRENDLIKVATNLSKGFTSFTTDTKLLIVYKLLTRVEKNKLLNTLYNGKAKMDSVYYFFIMQHLITQL